MNVLTREPKTIRIVSNKPRQEREVTVHPGNSFGDVLDTIGLEVDDYMALKPSDQSEFAPTDEVYPHVGDGSKLHLILRADVGITYAPNRRGWATPAPIRTYKDDLGWRTYTNPAGGSIHEGHYYAAGQRWQGFVLERRGRLEFHIARPPVGFLLQTQWGACFHCLGNDGWWSISFVPGSEPRDLDSGLAAVNRTLQESFRQAAQKGR